MPSNFAYGLAGAFGGLTDVMRLLEALRSARFAREKGQKELGFEEDRLKLAHHQSELDEEYRSKVLANQDLTRDEATRRANVDDLRAAGLTFISPTAANDYIAHTAPVAGPGFLAAQPAALQASAITALREAQQHQTRVPVGGAPGAMANPAHYEDPYAGMRFNALYGRGGREDELNIYRQLLEVARSIDDARAKLSPAARAVGRAVMPQDEATLASIAQLEQKRKDLQDQLAQQNTSGGAPQPGGGAAGRFRLK